MKKLKLNFSYPFFVADTRQKAEPLALLFVYKRQNSGEFSYSPRFAVDKNSGEFSYSPRFAVDKNSGEFS